ncbi:AMP-binding protein [Brytella acorum]|uniref:AMP-binding protein n=1 Tax=Brytella acorum TaxID=2959299 RepID=UPI0025AD9F59|nr:AMP-binding protein [Brytella acorum]MDF3625129.1 AMP-binding protein [Brytella acorum]
MPDIPPPARQVWPDLSLVYAPERVLFQRDNTLITGTEFLAAAHRLAMQLPDQPVMNLCRELRGFTVLFAATLLRGQYVILTGNRTSDGLATLAASHRAVCVAIDGDPESAGLPHGAITLPDPFGRGVQPRDSGDAPFNPVIGADTQVAIVFTSGSTGEPVGHAKSWGGLVTRGVARRALLDPDPEPACLVGTVPPYHLYGFEAVVIQCLATRVTAMTGPGRYPADWRHQLRQTPTPGILVTTPLQLGSLVRSGLALPPIRRVVSASAPLDTEQAMAAETVLATEVTEIYGTTETGSVATRRTLDGPRWELCEGVALAIDARGATVTAPGMAAQLLPDVVERDGERGLRLMGRIGDLVKFGGKRASMAGLNAALLGIEGVRDGVFLRPESNIREAATRMRVFAVAPGCSAESILEALRARVEPAFLPRRVRLVAALPRNAMGKLTLGAVRDLAAQNDGMEDIGTFSMSATHPCLAGHFPDQPVVPGVMLLEAGLTRLRNAGFGTVRRIGTAKFLRPVLPGESVTFFAGWMDHGLRLTGRCGDKLVLRAVLQAGEDDDAR